MRAQLAACALVSAPLRQSWSLTGCGMCRNEIGSLNARRTTPLRTPLCLMTATSKSGRLRMQGHRPHGCISCRALARAICSRRPGTHVPCLTPDPAPALSATDAEPETITNTNTNTPAAGNASTLSAMITPSWCLGRRAGRVALRRERASTSSPTTRSASRCSNAPPSLRRRTAA